MNYPTTLQVRIFRKAPVRNSSFIEFQMRGVLLLEPREGRPLTLNIPGNVLTLKVEYVEEELSTGYAWVKCQGVSTADVGPGLNQTEAAQVIEDSLKELGWNRYEE